MENETKKIEDLFVNEDFVKGIIEANNDEEVKTLFKENGFEISDEQLGNLKMALAELVAEMKKLSPEDLQKLHDEELAMISGGSLEGAGIGAGIGATIGFSVGTVKALIDIFKSKDYGSFSKDLLVAYAKMLGGAVAGALIGAGVGAFVPGPSKPGSLPPSYEETIKGLPSAPPEYSLYPKL